MNNICQFQWIGTSTLDSRRFRCGNCGNDVASTIGYIAKTSRNEYIFVYICHVCNRPTLIVADEQVPGEIYGMRVLNISAPEVENLYLQARNCMSVNAYTASVLCCRKLLMNLAVSKGAKEGENFFKYVDYLATEGYIPPNGKEWVEQIRLKGNEATHEIAIMDREDAEMLLDFSGMLLKFIYEFPEMIKSKIKQ